MYLYVGGKEIDGSVNSTKAKPACCETRNWSRFKRRVKSFFAYSNTVEEGMSDVMR